MFRSKAVHKRFSSFFSQFIFTTEGQPSRNEGLELGGTVHEREKTGNENRTQPMNDISRRSHLSEILFEIRTKMYVVYGGRGET